MPKKKKRKVTKAIGTGLARKAAKKLTGRQAQLKRQMKNLGV